MTTDNEHRSHPRQLTQQLDQEPTQLTQLIEQQPTQVAQQLQQQQTCRACLSLDDPRPGAGG